jgi:hypothetical protein
MELLRGDQTTRRVRLACGVIALATLALAACNNDNTQTGPGGANTLVFVGNVNGANASSSGSIVLTIDETRVAATFKVVTPSQTEDGSGTGDNGTPTGGDEGNTTGDDGTATGTQTSTTLQDINKTWTPDEWVGHVVRISAGRGAGQTSTVSSNDVNTLTVSPAWITTPEDGKSEYFIGQTSTTLEDPTKSWTPDQWVGRTVRINAGTGAGQTSTVSSNTATTLTVSPAWDEAATPDATSEYFIEQTSTTLEDVTKSWTTDQWAGHVVRITAGNGAGVTRTVSSNTATTLTVSTAWAEAATPDASSEYRIGETSTTLQDITKSWTIDQWAGRTVKITAGTGAGQTRTVSSNTANTLTVSTAWTTTGVPDGTSRYFIPVTVTATVGPTGTYNTSSRAVSASGGGYSFDGAYDGSSRLEGTFTGPSSSSGTFLTERATSNPQAYCGTFTSQTGGENGVFNVTRQGSAFFGTSTGDGATVLALDGTVLSGDNGTGTGDDGTATGTQTSTTLKDNSKVWTTDQWAGYFVKITAGRGAGQTRTVSSNTGNTLTVSLAWSRPPDETSQYVLGQTSTTLQDVDKSWTTDEWAGRRVNITAGTGAGQTRTVSSNSDNTLTVSPAWTRPPDGTSQYVIAIGITIPPLATGQGNSTISRLAGAFTFGANQGIWDGARCDQ